ncbi:MAG TPA: acetylglutamate kinase [Gemmatimonadaceae bacterium]|nr:acetylglutamate kinase [Gemmatimonadaceae bacterium]
MTRVVKLGGRAQNDPALAATLAAAWRAGRGALCVVHGGGDEISALQRRLGMDVSFRGGRRVTTPEDIEVVRMALSGIANKRLVSALVSAGVEAVGLSGEDAGLIAARPSADLALGAVGEPDRINVALLWHMLDGGYLPVISPLARAARGERAGGALNVNGDDAAAAIAVALAADELLLIADVPGVLVDGAPAASLDVVEARALVRRGVAGGGMAAKLEAAMHALRNGVARVRIGDLAAIAAPARGTAITLEGSLV